MTETNFADQKRYRTARLIEPPNTLKEKVGSGGIDPRLLDRAQSVMDSIKIDFLPLAKDFIKEAQSALHDISSTAASEKDFEPLIQPIMQIKAQGGMFGYPSMTLLAEVIVDFIETLATTDAAAKQIITSGLNGFEYILRHNVKTPEHPVAQNLKKELLAACARYHQAKSS